MVSNGSSQLTAITEFYQQRAAGSSPGFQPDSE